MTLARKQLSQYREVSPRKILTAQDCSPYSTWTGVPVQ